MCHRQFIRLQPEQKRTKRVRADSACAVYVVLAILGWAQGESTVVDLSTGRHPPNLRISLSAGCPSSGFHNI